MTAVIVGNARWIMHIVWSIWAGLETIVALAFPNPAQRVALFEIARIGDFDHRHYRPQIPGNHWLYALFSRRHYAVFGERLGLSPNAYFQPKAYLRLNPDVADAGVSPYWHWLTKGRSENRRIFDAPAPAPIPTRYHVPITPRNRSVRADFACHIHVHYQELWVEIQNILSGLSLELDIFVTLSYCGPETVELKAQIENDCPDAEVFIVENRGRDILPFLRLLNAGVFDDYQAVCKLHTKRSVHRADGDRWRRRLIRGIVSPKTPHLLAKFLADTNLAIWAADGQILRSKKWWGTNKCRTEGLLHRIGLKINSDCPYFPSGSMFWIKPFTLGLLKSLQLDANDFEDETGALDGTTAHAVERVVGELALAAGQTIIETSELSRRPTPAPKSRPSYVSAFYLPQYHRVPENDAWWGDGYTEWMALKRARPLFNNHVLRHPPTEDCAYDLSDPYVMERQAQLATKHGIDGFCVYFYWFGRKRMLEKPLDQLLQNPNVAFPFYLCWANESWRRNWDGLSGEILMAQEYPAGFEVDLAQQLAPYLRDSRYQRPDGSRRRFVIYRPEDLPEPKCNISRLRSALRDLGLGEIELGGVRFHTQTQDAFNLVDFWIEMPPHGFFERSDCLSEEQIPKGLVSGFDGILYDYQTLAERAVQKKVASNTIVGVMPSWDNSPRRGSSGHIAHGATPAGFRQWLAGVQAHKLSDSYRNEVFINAWNEWGETAMLEPCDRFGDLNLRAVSEVLGR